MNLTEYQQKAARTLKHDIDPGDYDISLVWNTMGLVGEAIEVVFADGIKTKEFGDVLWYIAAIATKNLSVNLQEFEAQFLTESRDTGSAGLILRAGTLVEYVKKGVFHKHGISKYVLRAHLYNVYYELRASIEMYPVSFGEIMEENIKKLDKRYKHGFTEEESINRD